MTLLHDAEPVTLGVHLRSSVMGVVEARQSEVLDRVQQLERSGTVEDVSVSHWASTVTAPDDGAPNDSGCPDVVTELYEFVADSDHSLRPFFRERTGNDRTRTTLFLPVVCVVVRRGGTVEGVFPSTRKGRHWSVQDGLDALEAGEFLATVD